VAGACIGTDAHTVGIDAILNMKATRATTDSSAITRSRPSISEARVAVEDLVRFAKEKNIDAILASQVVTQKGSDVRNFTALVELLEAEGLRDRVVTICGGRAVTNLMASELGYDAGFGRGTLPSEVASFIALRLAERPALSRS